MDGALALLDDADVRDLGTSSFRFMLYMRSGRIDDALALTRDVLDTDLEKLPRSTWLLRRGLIHVQRGERGLAVEDLMAVTLLSASEDHLQQAQAALLRAAELPSS